MKPQDLGLAILSGSILVIFGLIPGLLHSLAAGVRNALDSVSSAAPPPEIEYDKKHRPIWLAGLGVMFVVLSVLEYLSNPQ